LSIARLPQSSYLEPSQPWCICHSYAEGESRSKRGGSGQSLSLRKNFRMQVECFWYLHGDLRRLARPGLSQAIGFCRRGRAKGEFGCVQVSPSVWPWHLVSLS